MAQVTFYLPKDLEEAVRDAASREGVSLSAWIAARVRDAVGGNEWPADFDDLFGSWVGEVPEMPDSPPEPIPDL